MSSERKRVVQYVVDVEAGTITYVVAGAGQTTLDLNKTTQDTRQAALYNGFKQAGGDKAAIARDSKTGRSATPGEKFARIKAWVEHLNAGGAWELPQAARAALNRDALFEAVAAAKGVSLDTVLAKWGNMPEDFLRVRLTDADVAAEYARRTASGSEEEDLFEGLE